MKTKLLALIASLALAGCLGLTGCGSSSSSDSTNEDTAASSSEAVTAEQETEEAVEEEPAEEEAAPEEPTLGSTIEFDELSITFGDSISTATLDNEFDEHNGETVVAVPISVTNNKDEASGLNMFYCKEFGSQGTELDSVYFYFDDDIRQAGEARPGATLDGNYYMLYDGNGDYYISFETLIGSPIEVKIPVNL